MTNDQIFEIVVTTQSPAGAAHVAPMGVRYRPAPADESGPRVVLMPFRPSTTLDNIERTGHAVLNLVTDTRVFAAAVTGRRDFALAPGERIAVPRLAVAIGHVELRLVERRDDPQRPVLEFARVHEARHGEFAGFNRAQAAVIEGAVLVSRLGMLEPEKVEREMAYLQIAIDKTAGPGEHEAWGWLRDAVEAHARRAGASTDAGGAR